MKFSCSLEDLRTAVNHVSLFSSQRSAIPALEGILLDCSKNRLHLKAYDLEIGIHKEMSVSSEEDGSIILQAHLLSEILKKMDDTMIEILVDSKNKVQIHGEKTEFSILGMPVEEFPDLPNMEENASIQIKDKQLKRLIDQTLFAASISSQTPVLNGAIFEKKGEKLTVAAVDGYRVAMAEEEVGAGQDFEFIAPSKALHEISKILEEQGENESQIYVGEKHASFQIGGYQVITRLLEGEFIDYKNAVPKEIKTELFLETQKFLQAIERVSIMIDIKNKIPVKMNLQDGKIELHCESAIGKVQDALDVECKGENLQIAYNNRYMIDALRHAGCKNIRVRFNGPLAPIAILPEETEEFIFLVLPVRLKADE